MGAAVTELGAVMAARCHGISTRSQPVSRAGLHRDMLELRRGCPSIAMTRPSRSKAIVVASGGDRSSLRETVAGAMTFGSGAIDAIAMAERKSVSSAVAVAWVSPCFVCGDNNG